MANEATQAVKDLQQNLSTVTNIPAQVKNLFKFKIELFKVIKNSKFLTIESFSLILLIFNIISVYKESVLRMRNHLNTTIILRYTKSGKIQKRSHENETIRRTYTVS